MIEPTMPVSLDREAPEERQAPRAFVDEEPAARSGETDPAGEAASAAESGVRTLPRIRARLLEALCREDFRTIQQELPHYQDLLEKAARSGAVTPDRLARLESEHHRFHEQLRATLLTTRIRLRLDLERLTVARQYLDDDGKLDGIDLQG